MRHARARALIGVFFMGMTTDLDFEPLFGPSCPPSHPLFLSTPWRRAAERVRSRPVSGGMCPTGDC